MLLTGTFPRTIDEKQRLAIPKRIRDAMRVGPAQDDQEQSTGAVYVAPGTDGSLAIYTEEAFSRLAEQLASSPPTGQDVRAFSRLFYSQAERADLDRQGRIRIPPELAKLAGLDKEVVLVGVRDHLELWDKDRWEAYRASLSAQYDQLAERAFSPPR